MQLNNWLFYPLERRETGYGQKHDVLLSLPHPGAPGLFWLLGGGCLKPWLCPRASSSRPGCLRQGENSEVRTASCTSAEDLHLASGWFLTSGGR